MTLEFSTAAKIYVFVRLLCMLWLEAAAIIFCRWSVIADMAMECGGAM